MPTTDVILTSPAGGSPRPGECRADRPQTAQVPLLAEISHDLRSPLGAILGLIGLALDDTLAPTVRDYLETARKTAQEMLRLLDRTLDLSSLESGGPKPDCAPFSIRQLAGESTRSLYAVARHKGLELLCDVDSAVPDRLSGDTLWLRLVLTNLLSNALKYTDSGRVSLQVVLQGQGAGLATLQFRVIDTGIGIAAEDQARVFLPFVRAETDGQHDGKGLGLAIARNLVAAMGGSIGVDSRLGAGSNFYFTVPLPLAGE